MIWKLFLFPIYAHFLLLRYDSIFEYTYVLNPGWQLISIVLNLDDASKELLLSFTPYSYAKKATFKLLT